MKLTKIRRRMIGYDGSLDDDGMLEVAAIIGKFSECLRDDGRPPSLSQTLADLLNGDALSADSKGRLEKIIQLLNFQKQYQRLLTEHLRLQGEQAADLLESPVLNLYSDALIGCNFELNGMLERYKVTPQTNLVLESGTLYFVSSESGREVEAETGAVMCALKLADRAQMDNVRRCLCGKYFVPSRIDQVYCSTTCRVKAYQASEESKAKRRKADRERYRLYRDGKVKGNIRRKRGSQKAR